MLDGAAKSSQLGRRKKRHITVARANVCPLSQTGPFPAERTRGDTSQGAVSVWTSGGPAARTETCDVIVTPRLGEAASGSPADRPPRIPAPEAAVPLSGEGGAARVPSSSPSRLRGVSPVTPLRRSPQTSRWGLTPQHLPPSQPGARGPGACAEPAAFPSVFRQPSRIRGYRVLALVFNDIMKSHF